MTIRRRTVFSTAALAATLAACTNGSPEGTSGGDPVRGGSLSWGVGTEPTAGGVDPMVATALAANLIMNQAYETLLTRSDDGELQPGLATDWATPDDLTFVFTLRTDAAFADGTPFTADDVVYTFETYQQAQTSKRAYLVNLAAVEATGEHEVTLRLSAPDGTLMNALSSRETFMVVGRAGYGGADADTRQRSTFGTGPFQVTDWTDGVSITLSRNPNHPDEKPLLDEVVLELLPDESTRLAALQQGSVQAASFTDSVLADQAGQSGSTLGDPSYTQGIQVFVNPESGPLSDVRVRQAFSLALDRQALVDTAMFGYGAVSIIPPSGDPSAPVVDGDTPNYTRDVAAAKELLAAAGQPNPEITISYFGDASANQHPIYELMQQQVAEAGITLVLAAKPVAEIAPTFTAGESFVDLVSIPGYLRADPAFYFDAFLSEAGALNHWRGNPDADTTRDLLAQVRATLDPARKAELVDQLADEVARQVLLLVVMAVPTFTEVWDGRTLQGYASDPYGSRYRLSESWLAA